MPPSFQHPVALPAGIFLSGAAMMGYFVAALDFLRFWKMSRDLLFALAFFLLGGQRIAMLWWSQPDEGGQVFLYGLRLIAFLVILVAIVDKNRSLTAPQTRVNRMTG
jgi:hypothetical protein